MWSAESRNTNSEMVRILVFQFLKKKAVALLTQYSVFQTMDFAQSPMCLKETIFFLTHITEECTAVYLSGANEKSSLNIYVSLRLRVQNAVSPQPCVGKFRISLVLLNFLHCNFRLWFKTP